MFEGDILLEDDEQRNAISVKAYHWPQGIIPYIFNSNVSKLLQINTSRVYFIPLFFFSRTYKFIMKMSFLNKCKMSDYKAGISNTLTVNKIFYSQTDRCRQLIFLVRQQIFFKNLFGNYNYKSYREVFIRVDKVIRRIFCFRGGHPLHSAPKSRKAA